MPKAGGFTITSLPSRARGAGNRSFLSPTDSGSGSDSSSSALDSTNYPYLELAVQRSPSNPPAAALFRPGKDLLGQVLHVRVGGSFVFPPSRANEIGNDDAEKAASFPRDIKKIVFVAGGVGINPLMSILSFISEQRQIALSSPSRSHSVPGGSVDGVDLSDIDVQFLYSTKLPKDVDTHDQTQSADQSSRDLEELDASKILFLERLGEIFAKGKVPGRLRLFLTGDQDWDASKRCLSISGRQFGFEKRRIQLQDVAGALGSEDDKKSSIVYVCGVPAMTDYFVEQLTSSSGLALNKQQVLSEKWW